MLTLLIDASSLIYRAWFALPDTIRGANGEPVHAIHGFVDMLARLIATYRPESVVCAFDDDWRPQWRVDLVPEYKAHRVELGEGEGAGPEEQMPAIRDLLAVAGIACVGAEGYEAEDVIGTLAARSEGRAGIVSGDRDLFSLVRDPDVFVLYPKRGVSDLETVDEAWIERRYGIPGSRYFDYAVLRGDPSDGLPGVPGIGEKTAAALVRSHGSLEAIVAAAEGGAAAGALGKVAAHLDYVRRAAQCVRIADSVPIGRVRTALPPKAPAALVEAGESLRVLGPVRRLAEALDARSA